MISIEVVYALPDHQTVIALNVPPQTTAIQAIQLSEVLPQFPELTEKSLEIGIFGHSVSLDTPIKAGDRLEIYRPLMLDPKENRLKRVKPTRRKGHHLYVKPIKSLPKSQQ